MTCTPIEIFEVEKNRMNNFAVCKRNYFKNYFSYRLYVIICQSNITQSTDFSVSAALLSVSSLINKLLHQKSVCVISPIGSIGCSNFSIIDFVFGRICSSAANSLLNPLTPFKKFTNCGKPCSTNC